MRNPQGTLLSAVLSAVIGLLSLVPVLFAQRDLSGASEIRLHLSRLNNLGSVLMIAAHPDDENTALLAYFARGRAMRTAYLSATRGEGGQNLIGSEQGDLLGLIRTQELLAARKIDGAQQLFTRAIDFGFTKTLEETLEKWGRERILSDMVYAIREFRPDIIVLRFSGTPRDGHGQHQASAVLGKEAFTAAADASRFPDHKLPAWQAKRLLFNIFAFTRQQQDEASRIPGRLELDLGEYNPLLGKSYAEIAGISRSQHRSQGMGAPERRGAVKDNLVTIAGDPAASDPFDGIDTTWNRLPGGAPIASIIDNARRTVDVDDPSKAVPLLLKARPLMAAIDHPLARLKLKELDETIVLCAGLWLDTTADRHTAVSGSTLQLTQTVVNRSHLKVTWLPGTSLAYNQPATTKRTHSVPKDAALSQPFWLEKPKEDAAYTVDRSDLRIRPESPPWAVPFDLEIEGQPITVLRNVSYRYVDPVEGELTRPIVIAPSVAVNLPERVILFPNQQPQLVSVQLKANVDRAAGEIRLALEGQWKADPPQRSFELKSAGEQTDLTFTITPGPGAAQSVLRVLHAAKTGSGMRVIAYPHIPPQTVFPLAEARLEALDIKSLARKVGYVMGAGDEIPRSLRQLGMEVTLLTPDDLARRDLTEFDAIVAGVRAYNTRPDLRANQQRLIDYVNSGGTMIVQYNVPEGGPIFQRETGELARLGPYPIKIGRGRVTVEESPISIPNPKHPLLTRPNQITQWDFEGWVQERGLYFASEWAPEYQSVWSTHDPGEAPLPGGVLFARFGKGVYIFTAYSWFRQLPAGVPGAYRIFANMLSAGK